MDSLELCRKYKEREYMDRVSHIVRLEYLEGIHGESIVISLTEELSGLLERVSDGLSRVKRNSCRNVTLLDAIGSASIEGSSASIDSISEFMEGGSLSRNDLMVFNIIKAVNIYRGKQEYSIGSIVEMWKTVSDGVCENMQKQGSLFRSEMVYIGSDLEIIHTPELPKNITSRMVSLVKFLNSDSIVSILKGIVCHYYIEYIHPMCDCNGRLGRLLQNVIIGGNIDRIAVNSVINENLSGYYKAIKNSNVSCNVCGLGMCIDVAPFVEYILRCMMMAIG